MTLQFSRRSAIGIGLGLAAMTLTTACGDDSPTSGASKAPEGAPRYGGTFVVAIQRSITTFNVNYTTDGQAYYLNNNVLSKLCNSVSDSSRLAPDLALSWEPSSDFKSWTFKLRKDVKWHDGKPFTAKDVVFTFTSILKEGAKAYTYQHYSDIDKITAVDDLTVKFDLKAPSGVLPEKMAEYYGANILPAHIYDGTDVFKNPADQKPIGTGPFMFESMVADQQIVLTPYKDYYGGAPYVDKMVFRIIPNRATQAAALAAGEVHVTTMSPAFGEIDAMKTNGVDVAIERYPLFQNIGINFDNQYLKDVKVRQALHIGMDRDQINKQIFANYSKPALMPWYSWSWAVDGSTPKVAYDPDKANKLLDEAGYPKGANGMRFSLRYSAFRTSIFGSVEIPQVLKEQWKKIGIDLQVTEYDFAIKAEMIRKNRNFDLVSDAGIQGPDPDSFVQFLGSNGNSNTALWKNAVVDKAFAEGRTTTDQAKRREQYQIVWKEMEKDLPRMNVIEYYLARPYRTDTFGHPWSAAALKAGLGKDMYNLCWMASGTEKPAK